MSSDIYIVKITFWPAKGQKVSNSFKFDTLKEAIEFAKIERNYTHKVEIIHEYTKEELLCSETRHVMTALKGSKDVTVTVQSTKPGLKKMTDLEERSKKKSA